MPKNKFLQFSIYLLAILIPAAAMTYLILGASTLSCEVCIEYKGRSQCRKATGPDREQCQRTATDNACAFLASGMTESIQCGSTEPKSVKF